MNREEVHKLLGGYATGTLTPEERQALFAAALDDQELFDSLAREQSLRDLLRDPAAKAQVLAALDAALDTARVPWYRHGWWRPAAVAAAMAGIAVMAVVMTRKQAPAPQPVIVAELKAPEQAQTAGPGAEIQGPGAGGQGPGVEPGVPAAARARALTLPKREQATAPPPPREEPAIVAASGQPVAASGNQVAAPPALPATAPAPTFSANDNVAEQAQAPRIPMAQQGQQGQQARQAQQAQQFGQLGIRDAAAGTGALDSRFLAANARLLFYANPVAAEPSFKQKSAGKTAPPERARAANSLGALAALTVAPVFHLGVRCSILRKQAGGETAEAGIGTVLDAGEPVTLKLVPNDRGNLRVWERGPNGGMRTVASGTAQPLQPFEASLPEYTSSGARQLYVQFTRAGVPVLSGAALQSSQFTMARVNLIQTVADEPEMATYVVNRFSDPATPQLLVPITLNYK